MKEAIYELFLPMVIIMTPVALLTYAFRVVMDETAKTPVSSHNIGIKLTILNRLILTFYGRTATKDELSRILREVNLDYNESPGDFEFRLMFNNVQNIFAKCKQSESGN